MNRWAGAAAAGAALTLSLLLGGCAAPREGRSEAQAARGLMHDATLAVQSVVTEGERPGLRSALHGACAALVFPHVRGGGFFAGWSAGAGVLLMRDAASGHWIGPAFFGLDELTIGPEVALSTWELIVVFERCEALDPLKNGARRFSLRTSLARQSAEDEAGVAVGRGVRAFARTQGAVVGLSLHVVALHADAELAAACYGRATSPAQALAADVQADDAVLALRSAIERAAR